MIFFFCELFLDSVTKGLSMIDTLLTIWSQYGINSIGANTIDFLVFQVVIFLFACTVCLAPLFVRWIHLLFGNILLNKINQKQERPETSREMIRAQLFIKAPWARNRLMRFSDLWNGAGRHWQNTSIAG